MPVGRVFARVLAGAAGAHLGLRLAGCTTGRVGPLRVRAAVGFGRGGVTVAIPPVGTATLRTHRGPLHVIAQAIDIDPDRTGALLATGAALEPALAAVRSDGRVLGRALAMRAVLAALGGAAVTGAVALRRTSDVAGGTATGGALLAAGAAIAAATLDRDAWRDPQLTGLLAQAPLVLGDLRTAPQRIATYRDQLAELLATGTAVLRQVTELPEPPPADALRLLHVSDIHLNPIAFALIRTLVASYRVDAVVDTGDLVDWGTPLERSFADDIATLGVPYVFVKGNHDSDGIAAAVAAQPNAVVLTAERGIVPVAGLRFAGMADPRFTPDKTTGDDAAAHRAVEAATEFATRIKNEPVDIVLVHDPAAARAITDGGVRAPLVLAGHTHRRTTRHYGDTVLRTEASTGGSGLRGVQQQPPTPLGLSVLYLERATKRLAAADEITLGGLGGVALEITRQTVR